jgi:hypothetical protein
MLPVCSAPVVGAGDRSLGKSWMQARRGVSARFTGQRRRCVGLVMLGAEKIGSCRDEHLVHFFVVTRHQEERTIGMARDGSAHGAVPGKPVSRRASMDHDRTRYREQKDADV